MVKKVVRIATVGHAVFAAILIAIGILSLFKGYFCTAQVKLGWAPSR